jgi:hypothetical protein
MKKPTSISELLAGRSAGLSALQAGARQAQDVLAITQEELGPTDGGYVFAASLNGDTPKTLDILVTSGAHATRVRYAIPDALQRIGDRLGETIGRTRIRVRSRQ